MAHKIAKCEKPHTTAEGLIFPAALDMVNIMVDQSSAHLVLLLLKMRLSNITIGRRIQLS